MDGRVEAQNSPAGQMVSKVPEVTRYFWNINIVATMVGETAADFLIFNLELGLTNRLIFMGVLNFGSTVPLRK